MKIDVITIFPEMFENVLKWGVLGKAIEKGLIEIRVHDLRNWTHDKHKQVDDRPFGGGPGMILKPEPLFEAVESLKSRDDVKEVDPLEDRPSNAHVIFLTPQGATFTQEKAEELSKMQHLILICGRYEGIDQRVRNEIVDEEISVGNYVLSGGEIPAMVLVDSVTRLVPGVIGNEEFNKNESFSDPKDRSKLDHHQYTRPANYKGMKVPDVLLSGDHKEIERWRKKTAVPTT